LTWQVTGGGGEGKGITTTTPKKENGSPPSFNMQDQPGEKGVEHNLGVRGNVLKGAKKKLGQCGREKHARCTRGKKDKIRKWGQRTLEGKGEG